MYKHVYTSAVVVVCCCVYCILLYVYLLQCKSMALLSTGIQSFNQSVNQSIDQSMKVFKKELVWATDESL